MKSTSPADQIATALKLRNTLQHYLDMQSWTPAMGAMLFAGIHPPSDCEVIPTTGGTSLDGNPIIGCGNTPFYEANLILQQWNDWCADEGNFPARISPLDFFNWCIEDEIQERYAVSSSFIWISAFKNALGNNTAPLPFEIAEYIAATKEPLLAVLSKIDKLEREIKKQDRSQSTALVSISAQDKSIQLIANPHRQHLTTDEFAKGLDVMPQTIYKGHQINGHYCGVRPIKLDSRKLAWPLDAIEIALRKKDGK